MKKRIFFGTAAWYNRRQNRKQRNAAKLKFAQFRKLALRVGVVTASGF